MQPKSIDNKTDLADYCGVSRQTIHKWLRTPGFPVEPDGSISPYKVGRWSVLREIEGDLDADSDGDDSDGVTAWKIKNLQEDHRRKKLANDASESSLIPRDAVANVMDQCATLLRDSLSQLQREYGNDAADIMVDAIEKFEANVNAIDSDPAPDNQA